VRATESRARRFGQLAAEAEADSPAIGNYEATMSTKQGIEPTSLPKPFGVWTPAIACEPGKMLFISGLTARAPDGSVVGEGDYRAQTRQICENLKATVEAAGGTLDNIMSVTVFVVGLDDFTGIHEVRREYFPATPPASTLVQVSSLVDPKCLIEINAIAVI
jgi:2-iminobutanoate/2-iminopropanoate deaminase